jgi:hypothetical protein
MERQEEVLAVSRRHTDSKTKIQQREGVVKVPIMVVDYSDSKPLADLSYQKKASSLAL